MDYGIVLGLFDFKVGPYPVYFRNVSKDIASKIVIKGTIFQGSLQTTQSSGESIISFPSQLVSAYIYLYLQEDIEREFPILIAFVTDIKDQSSLYHDASELREISDSIKEDILSINNYLTNPNLNSEIENLLLTKYTQTVFDSMLHKANIVSQLQNTSETGDYQLKPLNLLNHMVKKNLDQVIYGLIAGIPIVIHGKDQQLVKLTINSFETITSHRKLRTAIINDEQDIGSSSRLYDIVGTIKPVKANKTFILLDLEKGKVKGGRKNSYCEKMFNDLLEAEEIGPMLLQMLSKRRINWLLTSVSTLIQVEDEKSQKDAVKKLTNTMDRDSLYLIAKLVEEQNPIMFKYIVNSYNFRTRLFKAIF